MRYLRPAFAAVLCLAVAALLSGCGTGERADTVPPVVQPVTAAVFANSGLAMDDGSGLARIAGVINQSPAAFAVDLGNRLPPGALPADALWDVLDRERGAFTIPVFSVPGGNDIYDYESDIAWSARYGPLWYGFVRNGVGFAFIHTGDEERPTGFGGGAAIGADQLDWLETTLHGWRDRPVVVFMHRPVWRDDPRLWMDVLRPLFEKTGVDCMVAADRDGLCDLGLVNSIRAITTGCVGPEPEPAPGAFPHALFITVDAEGVTLAARDADGREIEPLPVTAGTVERLDEIVRAAAPPVLAAEADWTISRSEHVVLENPFDVPLEVRLGFTAFRGTSWTVPPETALAVAPGERVEQRFEFGASPPDMGPLPAWRMSVALDGRVVRGEVGTLAVAIPRPRTGDLVTIDADVPELVPYRFDGSPVAVPVIVKGTDICGRLIIYRERNTEIPVCLYISPLRDLRPGMNEFTWNGRGLDGALEPPDSLTCRVFLYNKEAPATWVAAGPPGPYGTLSVHRDLLGLYAETHGDADIRTFRIGESVSAPAADIAYTLQDITGSPPLTGFSDGDDGIRYLGTELGIAAVTLGRDGPAPAAEFGDDGYVRLTAYRGRRIGPPAAANGVVYVGIGGGEARSPLVCMLDGTTGESIGEIDLGGAFGEAALPPAVAADAFGVTCTHPDSPEVLRFSLAGDLLWANDASSRVTGLDADGRSFIYGIGTDAGGYSYVCTPGTSARCGVLGPDGRGLFRIILVQLPGLRVSAVTPMIEGRETDGLYFTTRGGDIPYVFHVPFTVRTALMADDAGMYR